MKKVIFISILLLLSGCSLYNTPKKQVEIFLTKYQTLDEEVTDSLDFDAFKNNDLTLAQKDKYTDIMEKQYQNLVYEIKDERIDGKKALVTVEIEVYDYLTIINQAHQTKTLDNIDIIDENGIISNTLFIDSMLDKLDNAKERIKYTLEINLTKIGDNWVVDNLDKENIDKISGVYNY